MIEQILEKLNQQEETRENLIQLRAEIKDENQRVDLLENDSFDPGILIDFLTDEDPKVRKNAALILGELGIEQSVNAIFQAYQTESTRFVKADYLQALSMLPYESLLGDIEARYKELAVEKPDDESKKHIFEEMQGLQKLIFDLNQREKNQFTELIEPVELFILTNRHHRELTASQLPDGKKMLAGTGIRMKSSQVQEILQIRTVEELLFPISGCNRTDQNPALVAKAIVDSGIVDFLQSCHKNPVPFYFRIGMMGGMSLEHRSSFTKRAAQEIETLSQLKLRNSTSDYDIEFRCIPNRDGGFQVFLKLYTIHDGRFSYRKESVATSLKPQTAALIASLAKAYLKKDGQVLDPFCGVGTLLLERMKCVSAKEVYGIDIYGEAIEKARMNSSEIGPNIHYINRDYYDFEHDYYFDEIITELPMRGRMTKDELDQIFQMFFDKSREMLKDDGIIIVCSNEIGLIKKYLRLNKDYHILEDFLLDEKQDFHEYVIQYQVEKNEKTGR